MNTIINYLKKIYVKAHLAIFISICICVLSHLYIFHINEKIRYYSQEEEVEVLVKDKYYNEYNDTFNIIYQYTKTGVILEMKDARYSDYIRYEIGDKFTKKVFKFEIYGKNEYLFCVIPFLLIFCICIISFAFVFNNKKCFIDIISLFNMLLCILFIYLVVIGKI